jgi:hypothetical protein
VSETSTLISYPGKNTRAELASVARPVQRQRTCQFLSAGAEGRKHLAGTVRQKRCQA